MVPLFDMDNSPAVDAARHFLSTVWESKTPSDEELLFALDRLVEAFHRTPDVEPSNTELEAPRSGGPALYKEVAERFPAYGLYSMSDPTASIEDAAMVGDAIDDLADLISDMREVVWWADHIGFDDAHWSFRLHYFNWGRHARELGLYLHARQFG